MAGDKFLRIYLNDHLATTAAALALSRRMRESPRHAELRQLLETLTRDLADDLETLERTFRERGLKPSA